MSLLLVVVLLFFSSSCSVSSGQYYVSDDCSSVTQSPCNPLSVYAGNMSQYNNTIFYFIGTSVIDFTVTMDSVQNITLHGLDQSPTINCSSESIAITTSSHVSFSNLSFQQCIIYFEYSSNITITGSVFKNQHQSLGLMNVFDSKITTSVFDSVNLLIRYHPPPVCYNELHHYSLTLTNVTVTNGYLGGSLLLFDMKHGTSYNISVIIDNVNISTENYGTFSESLFSLYITNSSVSKSEYGFPFNFDKPHSQQSKYCNIKGVESRSTIVLEDFLFHINVKGIYFNISTNYFHLSNHHIIDITVKSCSIRDNYEYGLAIDARFSKSAHINVIDTELVGNKQNVIVRCHSVLFNNVTVANSLLTGLLIMFSVVTVKNRLVFKNNTGVVGGGMAINGSSVVALSPSANLEFIDNHATYKGGGIYMDESAGCGFIQVSPIPLTLKNNTAGVAGNDIYGRIYPNFHELFNCTNPSTSSDPRAFTFCDPDSNEVTPIWHNDEQQSVFPGQPLKYNVALFGRSSDSNSYSLTDGRITIEINGTLAIIDKYINNCSLIEYTPKFTNCGERNVTFNVTSNTFYFLFEVQLGISFILNECPIGFSVNSSGGCDCSVSIKRQCDM